MNEKKDFSAYLVEEVKRLREYSLSQLAQNTMNVLALSLPKVGKTHLISTGIRPIHIDSFDQGGTKIRVIQELVKSGDCIVDSSFEDDDFRRPTAFALWEDAFARRRRIGYFEHIGTYSVDSFTSWVDAALLCIASKRKREDNVPYLNDWGVIVNLIKDYVKLFAALPCDVILPGHLIREKDDVTGEIISKIDATPKMQNRIPQIFDEVYVLITKHDNKIGTKRVLITQPSGRYTAGSRLGGDGIFSEFEKPNMRNLRKKLGWSTEDKEKLL